MNSRLIEDLTVPLWLVPIYLVLSWLLWRSLSGGGGIEARGWRWTLGGAALITLGYYAVVVWDYRNRMPTMIPLTLWVLIAWLLVIVAGMWQRSAKRERQEWETTYREWQEQNPGELLPQRSSVQKIWTWVLIVWGIASIGGTVVAIILWMIGKHPSLPPPR